MSYRQRINETSTLKAKGFVGINSIDSNLTIDKSYIEKGTSFVNASKNSNVIIKDCGSPEPAQTVASSFFYEQKEVLKDQKASVSLPPWIEYNVFRDDVLNPNTAEQYAKKYNLANHFYIKLDNILPGEVDENAKDAREALLVNSVAHDDRVVYAPSSYSLDLALAREKVDLDSVHSTQDGMFFLSDVNSSIKGVWPLNAKYKFLQDNPKVNLHFVSRELYDLVNSNGDTVKMNGILKLDKTGAVEVDETKQALELTPLYKKNIIKVIANSVQYALDPNTKQNIYCQCKWYSDNMSFQARIELNDANPEGSKFLIHRSDTGLPYYTSSNNKYYAYYQANRYNTSLKTLVNNDFPYSLYMPGSFATSLPEGLHSLLNKDYSKDYKDFDYKSFAERYGEVSKRLDRKNENFTLDVLEDSNYTSLYKIGFKNRLKRKSSGDMASLTNENGENVVSSVFKIEGSNLIALDNVFANFKFPVEDTTKVSLPLSTILIPNCTSGEISNKLPDWFSISSNNKNAEITFTGSGTILTGHINIDGNRTFESVAPSKVKGAIKNIIVSEDGDENTNLEFDLYYNASEVNYSYSIQTTATVLSAQIDESSDNQFLGKSTSEILGKAISSYLEDTLRESENYVKNSLSIKGFELFSNEGNLVYKLDENSNANVSGKTAMLALPSDKNFIELSSNIVKDIDYLDDISSIMDTAEIQAQISAGIRDDLEYNKNDFSFEENANLDSIEEPILFKLGNEYFILDKNEENCLNSTGEPALALKSLLDAGKIKIKINYNYRDKVVRESENPETPEESEVDEEDSLFVLKTSNNGIKEKFNNYYLSCKYVSSASSFNSSTKIFSEKVKVNLDNLLTPNLENVENIDLDQDKFSLKLNGSLKNNLSGAITKMAVASLKDESTSSWASMIQMPGTVDYATGCIASSITSLGLDYSSLLKGDRTRIESDLKTAVENNINATLDHEHNPDYFSDREFDILSTACESGYLSYDGSDFSGIYFTKDGDTYIKFTALADDGYADNYPSIDLAIKSNNDNKLWSSNWNQRSSSLADSEFTNDIDSKISETFNSSSEVTVNSNYANISDIEDGYVLSLSGETLSGEWPSTPREIVLAHWSDLSGNSNKLTTELKALKSTDKDVVKFNKTESSYVVVNPFELSEDAYVIDGKNIYYDDIKLTTSTLSANEVSAVKNGESSYSLKLDMISSGELLEDLPLYFDKELHHPVYIDQAGYFIETSFNGTPIYDILDANGDRAEYRKMKQPVFETTESYVFEDFYDWLDVDNYINYSYINSNASSGLILSGSSAWSFNDNYAVLTGSANSTLELSSKVVDGIFPLHKNQPGQTNPSGPSAILEGEEYSLSSLFSTSAPASSMVYKALSFNFKIPRESWSKLNEIMYANDTKSYGKNVTTLSNELYDSTALGTIAKSKGQKCDFEGKFIARYRNLKTGVFTEAHSNGTVPLSSRYEDARYYVVDVVARVRETDRSYAGYDSSNEVKLDIFSSNTSLNFSMYLNRENTSSKVYDGIYKLNFLTINYNSDFLNESSDRMIQLDGLTLYAKYDSTDNKQSLYISFVSTDGSDGIKKYYYNTQVGDRNYIVRNEKAVPTGLLNADLVYPAASAMVYDLAKFYGGTGAQYNKEKKKCEELLAEADKLRFDEAEVERISGELSSLTTYVSSFSVSPSVETVDVISRKVLDFSYNKLSKTSGLVADNNGICDMAKEQRFKATINPSLNDTTTLAGYMNVSLTKLADTIYGDKGFRSYNAGYGTGKDVKKMVHDGNFYVIAENRNCVYITFGRRTRIFWK